MSDRTLVELNHDYFPGSYVGCLDWLEAMTCYYCSGDPKDLPKGVTFKNYRHHSDPCPLEPTPIQQHVKQALAPEETLQTILGDALAKYEKEENR